jgi:hypothetical protein
MPPVELKQKLRDLVATLCKSLDSADEALRLPTKEVVTDIQNSESNRSIQTQNRTDWNKIFSIVFERGGHNIPGLSEVQDQVRKWESSDLSTASDESLEKELGNFISSYLDRVQEAKIDEHEFEQIYAQFVDYHESNCVELRKWVILDGLSAEFDELELTDSIRLFRISPDDITQANQIRYSQKSQMALRSTHGLEICYQFKKGVPGGSQEAETLRDAITALRLITGARFGFSSIFSHCNEDYVGYQDRLSSSLGTSEKCVFFGDELTDEDKNAIADSWDYYWDSLSNVQSKAIQSAIRRYNAITNPDNSEDAVVDCFIGIEGTLLADTGRDSSITFRLKLRGAALLSDRTDIEKDQIGSLLQSLYAMRGEVVHKNKTIGEMNDPISIPTQIDGRPKPVVDICRRLLGGIILAYTAHRIESGDGVGQVNSKIDQKALNVTVEP